MNMNHLEKLAETIELAKRSGLTMTKLGAACGVEYTTIWYWQKMKNNITIERAEDMIWRIEREIQKK